jgi:hypothetical protein
VATLKSLLLSTKDYRKHVNPTNPFSITKVQPVPGAPSGQLIIQAEFDPLTDVKRYVHYTSIVFNGMSIINQRDEEHPFGIQVFKNYAVWSSKPSFDRTPVQVECTCSDYYYTWWAWNKEQFANMQDFPRYIRKGPKPEDGGLPYRNPDHIAGLCKHLISVSSHLAEKGFLLP